jgi:hypothetical protein
LFVTVTIVEGPLEMAAEVDPGTATITVPVPPDEAGGNVMYLVVERLGSVIVADVSGPLNIGADDAVEAAGTPTITVPVPPLLVGGSVMVVGAVKVASVIVTEVRGTPYGLSDVVPP